MSEITIIIPSYNHENFIEQRLDSILNQTYTDWEAIIIDDASTDNSVLITEDYIEKNKDFKVKYFIKNKTNSGSGYKSWQKGIAMAETKFIWIAETDDYSDPYFLEATLKGLKINPKAVLAFTASDYVNKNGEFLYNTDKRLKKLNLKENESGLYEADILLDSLPLDPLITNGSSVLFRKPPYPVPKEIFEHRQLSDLFLWTHLLQNKNFYCINTPLNNFRRHEASTTELNFNSENPDVYIEYVMYANYFKLDKAKENEILKHYVRHYLIPKRKSIGYFTTKPLQSLNKISYASKVGGILKGYLAHAFKLLKIE